MIMIMIGLAFLAGRYRDYDYDCDVELDRIPYVDLDFLSPCVTPAWMV